MLLLLLVPAAPLHLSQATDALAAANAAAAAAATNAAGTAVAAPLSVASSSSDCISFTSLSGDVTITAWCEANCKAGVCPEDKCKCITAADVQQAAASTASAGVAKLGTTLPKIASKISGRGFTAPTEHPTSPPAFNATLNGVRTTSSTHPRAESFPTGLRRPAAPATP